ncbi:MAG: hypothetical protein IJG65_10030 [Synergistaceae bacterium]|nr:hypothetical protein [Synergistaceae bacterium]
MMAGRFSDRRIVQAVRTLLDWGDDPNDIIAVMSSADDVLDALLYAIQNGGISSLFED